MSIINTTNHPPGVVSVTWKYLSMQDIHDELPQYFWLWDIVSCPSLHTQRHICTHTLNNLEHFCDASEASMVFL